MVDYKLIDGGAVLHRPSGMIVPNDPGNRHWVTYEAWLAAGNTPDPAVDGSELLKQRLAEVDALYEAKLEIGAPFAGKLIQVDPESRSDIQATYLRVVNGLGLPAGYPGWRAKDNTYVATTEADFLAMAAAASAHVSLLKYVKFAHKDALAAASKVSDAVVQGYDITAGW